MGSQDCGGLVELWSARWACSHSLKCKGNMIGMENHMVIARSKAPRSHTHLFFDLYQPKRAT